VIGQFAPRSVSAVGALDISAYAGFEHLKS
jgi:hypothetical protein